MAYEPISMIYKPACSPHLPTLHQDSKMHRSGKPGSLPTWDHHVCKVCIHSQLSYLLNIAGEGKNWDIPTLSCTAHSEIPGFLSPWKIHLLSGLGWLCLPISSLVTLIAYSQWQVKRYQVPEACCFFLVQDRKPSYILSRLLRATFWTKLADFPLKLKNNGNRWKPEERTGWKFS